VMLTHRNIWWTCESLEEHLKMVDAANGRALSYLPLSHIAERMVSHLLQILYGSETWFLSSVPALREDLQACRPTYFFGVPRVWEKFHAAVCARLNERPHGRRDRIEIALLRRALAVGSRLTAAEQEAVRRGGSLADARLSPGLRVQHAILDRLVLHKARARAGLAECRRTFSAGAPLDPEINRFFHSLGLKIAEGYGQSETNGPTTWNPPDAIKIGTVGVAIPGLELDIASDGEILVRGGNVTPGYYSDPEATAELLDEQGRLHSGDLGTLDEHGYLTITDRKKDLIITSGGKNIAPQEIEYKLKLADPISQVVVVGDGRPFLVALVTLDEEKAVPWAREHDIDGDLAEIAGHERTLSEVESAIDEVNATVARAEWIRKFRILDRDFSEDRDEVTPTLKIKRKRVSELYADVIEELYERESPVGARAPAPS
jgi:long-chain acyl-CoA synthetase